MVDVLAVAAASPFDLVDRAAAVRWSVIVIVKGQVVQIMAKAAGQLQWSSVGAASVSERISQLSSIGTSLQALPKILLRSLHSTIIYIIFLQGA